MSRFILPVILFAMVQPAVGNELTEQIQICAGIQDSAARLACFDAVGRGVQPATDVAPQPQPADSAPAKEVSPTVPAMPAATPPAAEPVGMGAETVAREQRKKDKKKEKEEVREVVMATIVRVTPQLDGRWTVLLDNGQVWRESQGSKVGVPKVDATVELYEGRFGGYRMKIDGLYRVAWVQRRK